MSYLVELVIKFPKFPDLIVTLILASAIRKMYLQNEPESDGILSKTKKCTNKNAAENEPACNGILT